MVIIRPDDTTNFVHEKPVNNSSAMFKKTQGIEIVLTSCGEYSSRTAGEVTKKFTYWVLIGRRLEPIRILDFNGLGTESMNQRPLDEDRLSIVYMEDWGMTDRVFQRCKEASQFETFLKMGVKITKSKTNSQGDGGLVFNVSAQQTCFKCCLLHFV